jgi:two-component system nitrate/nitrite response regulator NarL
MASDPVPESASPSCLLLAERHQGLLEGIQGLLGAMFGAVVTVSNEASLVEGVRLLRPALAVLDLGLGTDGLKTLRRVRELRPEQKIILLSPHDARSAAEAALRAGADGYVLKQSIAEDLLAATETVLAGGRYCSSRVGGALASVAPVVCSPPPEPLARTSSDPKRES